MSLFRNLLVCFVLLALVSPLSAGSIDVRTLKTLPLSEAALDVAATVDGKRIYVLDNAGGVQVFSAAGQLLGEAKVGTDVTGITPQGAENLILEKTGRQELTLISLGISEKIDVSKSPTLGPVNAPVSIVVFDDFECPYCAKAVPLLKQVQQAYPKQANLVFKNFPLKMHKNAGPAAIAGLAADRQGKFWPLHDLFFENYNKLNPQKIVDLAKQAGLNVAQFEKDQRDPKLAQQVQDEIRQGQGIGVRGTPTIFINGRRVMKRDLQEMTRMIDEELVNVKN